MDLAAAAVWQCTALRRCWSRVVDDRQPLGPLESLTNRNKT